jgi:hypothetical protein
MTTMKYEGLKDTSPLTLAQQMNSQGKTYKDIMPEIATHIAVWYFRSLRGDLSLPIATVAITDKSKTRSLDMIHWFLTLTGVLDAHGFIVRYFVADGHRINVVRTLVAHNLQER